MNPARFNGLKGGAYTLWFSRTWLHQVKRKGILAFANFLMELCSLLYTSTICLQSKEID
jgi:hypothetical protein